MDRRGEACGVGKVDAEAQRYRQETRKIFAIKRKNRDTGDPERMS